ncbi:MAG TPA: MFS transporter, partial [Candidatus Limnocylindrales bacterium]
DALLAVVVDRDTRSTVFAVRNMTLNAGYGIGAVLASLVVDLASPSSFEALYAVDGATFLAFIPILALVRPRQAHLPAAELSRAMVDQRTSAPGYRAVLRDRVFLRVWLLLAMLVAIGFAQTLSGFPAYATIVGGISAAGLSVAFAANTLTVVIAQFPILRFLEGRRRTTGIVLACACWGAAWTITLATGNGGQSDGAVLWFAVAMVVFAIGETLLAPSQAALINDLATDDLRGRYNGLYALAWTTGLAVGPAVAGAAISGGNGNALFGGLIVACALAAIYAARLARHLPADVNVVRIRSAKPGEAARA